MVTSFGPCSGLDRNDRRALQFRRSDPFGSRADAPSTFTAGRASPAHATGRLCGSTADRSPRCCSHDRWKAIPPRQAHDPFTENVREIDVASGSTVGPLVNATVAASLLLTVYRPRRRKKTWIARSCAGPSFFASTGPAAITQSEIDLHSGANRKRLAENGRIARWQRFLFEAYGCREGAQEAEATPTPATSEPPQSRVAVCKMSSCGRESGVCRPVSSPHAWLSARRFHSCTNFSVGGTGFGTLGPGATRL